MSKLAFEPCDPYTKPGPRVRYMGGKTSPLNGNEGNIVTFREGRTNALVLFDFDPQRTYWVYGHRLHWLKGGAE